MQGPYVEWRNVRLGGYDQAWMGSYVSRRKALCIMYVAEHPDVEDAILIVGLETDPAHRRNGYAGVLLEDALRHFAEDYAIVELAVKPYSGKWSDAGASEDALRNFYEKHGFQPTRAVMRTPMGTHPILRRALQQ